ncbi:MAG: glycoside hydrolase family 3 C-terminal domain-containing protein [Bacteroidales bacterium]|nr:glycoside hydrolase family 3 C-terminal domain-containing protein [Bacteroidales bacterium]
MKRLVALLFAVSMAFAASAQGLWSNPVIDGWYADPEGLVDGNSLWIYPTRSLAFDEQTYLDAFSSEDMVRWTKHQRIISTDDVKWARRCMWAPSVVKSGGTYYLFFSANDVHEGDVGGIGVAFSMSPSGPFKDLLGKPLIPNIVNGAQPIDQHVFHDPVSGNWYMYYGGWKHCNVVRLAPNFKSLIPFEDGTLVKEVTPQDYVEGPFMLYKDGKYYFMWSEGSWTRDNYRVAYAIADNPLGPFKREETILQSDPEIGTGAGHHSVVQDPKSGKYLIIYHRHPLGSTSRNDRVVCIDELVFAPDGKISPVKMTGSWIPEQAKERAAQLVSKMTLEEKCTLIHGVKGDGEYEDGFHIMPIPRLGIPAIRMADGPQGVRNKTRSTYYPCGISLAASWNREIAGKVGEGIGLDARARGVAIMLCPGVNIYRTALCGRNFEYYGEDPYLASEMALNYIKGIQGKGVMATIKHFALNNQEFDRHGVSSNADERTINEIYFPAFRKAVEKSDVACVMTSYNPINGTHASEDPWLIKGNLRAWGFEGIVMSDWTSTYSAIGCFTSGLDIEMPRGYVTNYDNAKALLEAGIISEEDIDEKCRHILQTVIAYGFLDNPAKDESIPEDCDISRANALAAALEGPVLLKNSGVLPLKTNKKKEIVVIGPNADIVPYGGGSGRMDPIEGRSISLYQGLSKLGNGYKVRLVDWTDPDYDIISNARAVIVAAGFNYNTEGEDFDRTYQLPQGQDELISRVADANPNTIVVVYSGGEIDVTPWIDKVGALIMAWYSGQEGGTAMAQLLSGQVSPSGRLPFSFWGSLEANPAYPNYGISKPYGERTAKRYSQYPFIEYNEGIFLGYRGMEHFGSQPMFPFGYGLTYADITYSDLSVSVVGDGVEVCFTLTNNGKTAASEVAQVYISAPGDSPVIMADMELKGYEKVLVRPKKSEKVKILLPRESFSHYSTITHTWVKDSGQYSVKVGASALDIRLSQQVDVTQ